LRALLSELVPQAVPPGDLTAPAELDDDTEETSW
jgi:hypothetical protein